MWPIAHDHKDNFRKRAASLSCENRRRSATAVLSASARLAHDNELASKADRDEELPLAFAMQMDLMTATRLEDAEMGEVIPTMSTANYSAMANLDVSGSDCFHACQNKVGFCEDYCGVGLACCLQGDPSAPYECRNVYKFTSKNYECVTPLVSPGTLQPWSAIAFIIFACLFVIIAVFSDVTCLEQVKQKYWWRSSPPLSMIQNSEPSACPRYTLLTSRTVVSGAKQTADASPTAIHEAHMQDSSSMHEASFSLPDPKAPQNEETGDGVLRMHNVEPTESRSADGSVGNTERAVESAEISAPSSEAHDSGREVVLDSPPPVVHDSPPPVSHDSPPPVIHDSGHEVASARGRGLQVFLPKRFRKAPERKP